MSGNRGLRQPRLISQTLQSLSLSSCSNLDCLYLSCPQLKRLQASPFSTLTTPAVLRPLQSLACEWLCGSMHMFSHGLAADETLASFVGLPESQPPSHAACNGVFHKEVPVDSSEIYPKIADCKESSK